MNNKLQHLNEKEINELIKRYYNNEKVIDLIKEFNISVIPSQFVKILPPEIVDEKCPYCNINLIRNRKSRNSPYLPKSYCPKCGHNNSDYCDCDECQKIYYENIKNEYERKQIQVNKLLAINEKNKKNLDTLSFKDKIYLGALLRVGISEDYNYIKPIEEFIIPLAPTNDFVIKIINHLLKENIILIHPDTNIDYIEINDDETGSFQYYIFKVMWYLNLHKKGSSKIELIEAIINPEELMQINKINALNVWKEIALYEVLEYLLYSVNNILGINYKIGNKTISTFKDLLNHFSTSQIYGIIYKATNNALRLQAETGMSIKHASNTIIGNAQSYAERAIFNKWELVKFNRIKELPESSISKFFFERVIKIGYNGFIDFPRIEMIKANNKINEKKKIKKILSQLFNNSIEVGDYEFSKNQIEKKWIGNPPANKSLIRKKENSLNIFFPNDYKNVISITNGFPSVNIMEPNFEKIENVAFFHDVNSKVLEKLIKEKNNSEIIEILEKSIIIGGINMNYKFLLIPPMKDEEWRYAKYSIHHNSIEYYDNLIHYFKIAIDFMSDIIQDNKKFFKD